MRINTTLAFPVVAMGLGALAVTGISAAGAAPRTTTATTSATAASAVACTADYSVIPANWSTEKGGLDIGVLTKVTSKNGVVKVRINRVSFYTGPEAKALNGGRTPLDGYVGIDVSPLERTFTLDPKASIIADYVLRQDEETGRKKINRAQFVRNAGKADLGDSGPLVWLRHTNGMTGNVTALAEQFTP